MIISCSMVKTENLAILCDMECHPHRYVGYIVQGSERIFTEYHLNLVHFNEYMISEKS